MVTVTVGNTTTVNFSCTTLTFNISFSFKDWIHFTGFSVVCFNFVTSPVQANMPFTTTMTGPSVTSPAQSGTTSATGTGTARYNIGLFGTYTIIVNVLNQSANTTLNVTSNVGGCPSQ